MKKNKRLPSHKEIVAFIEACIEARQEWASSPEGIKQLGPGSPNVPGMQEYNLILHFVKTGERPRR